MACGYTFAYLSLRCGCPVDTSAKQKPPTEPAGETTARCVAIRFPLLPVIAKVRVSGGHLCKAEAPTEPAGEMCKRLRQSVFPFYKAINKKLIADLLKRRIIN